MSVPGRCSIRRLYLALLTIKSHFKVFWEIQISPSGKSGQFAHNYCLPIQTQTQPLLVSTWQEPLTAACFLSQFPEDVGSLQQGQGLVVPVTDTGTTAS